MLSKEEILNAVTIVNTINSHFSQKICNQIAPKNCGEQYWEIWCNPEHGARNIANFNRYISGNSRKKLFEWICNLNIKL